MLKDLRHAVRLLLHAKGWTAVVVTSLALGIGANTALFSAINGLFLKKLPVSDPDTLVRLKWAGRNDMVVSSSDYGFSAGSTPQQPVRSTFSYPMFRQFVADNRTLTELFACAPYGRANLVVDGRAELASAFITSGNYYRVLGLTANPGRTIVPEDDRPGAPPVGVISARYWRSRFGSDPNVVGKVVQLSGVPITIVGVIAPVFSDVQQAVREGPDIGVPLALDDQLNTNVAQLRDVGGQPRVGQPTYWWLQIMGRMKRGVTVEQVQANLDGVFQTTARAGLDSYLASQSAEARAMSHNRNRTEVPRLRAESGSRGIYDVGTSDRSTVTILSVVVVLVLLIVCANVANLLLSRATARQKEISVRLSLGATRARLIRQLLTESLVVSSVGGLLGVVVAYWGKQLLPGVVGQATPLDARVLAFVLAVTALTGVVFGIAPALRATRLDVGTTLKETSRSVAGSRSLLSKGLLVLQVAISLVLLIAAGLFLRTLQNLRNVDVGFNTRNLVLFRVNPLLNRYDQKRMAVLYDQLADRIRAVAGVRSVALSNVPLLSGSVNGSGMYVAGRSYAPGQRDGVEINRLVVSPNFFDAMEMRLAAGRGFAPSDDEKAPKVAIVNEAAVRKFFPNESPIGQRFGYSVEDSRQFEIVGVLRDVKYNSVRDPAPPTMYAPWAQSRPSSAAYEVRTAGDPLAAVGAIREAVRQIDPDLPLTNMSTQIEAIEQRLLQEKVLAQAYVLFGALAVLIASIGLFGLMSYSVARRTNEIGIRMALGAQQYDVLGLVMRESMLLVVAGIAIGLTAALAAGRFVASLLFGLAPTDALTMIAAIALMTVVSAVAGYLPARRAARVDPIVALHYE